MYIQIDNKKHEIKDLEKSISEAEEAIQLFSINKTPQILEKYNMWVNVHNQLLNLKSN